jgi:Protein of unknown function (DUF1385)
LPGGRAVRHPESVQATGLAAVLARADATPLPLLGGMARPDGVVIVSERYFAFAGRDGSLLEGDMPRVPGLFMRVPLLRGLGRLVMSFSPLMQRGGVAGQRERILLTAMLLSPLLFAFFSGTLTLVAGFLMTGAMLAWLLRGRTLFLHGAEHRAIAAAEQGNLSATWAGETKPSRFSLRCGTNFVALVVPVGLIADRLWPFAPALWTPIFLAVLSLAVSMELWRAVQSSPYPAARFLLYPGLALQRLTTREPSLDETRLALTAAGSVLRRELG